MHSPDWDVEPDPKVQIQVFLVTAAKLVNDRDTPAEPDSSEDNIPALVDPASISKAHFRKAIQDSGRNPIYDRSCGGRPPCRQLEIDVYFGVKEGATGQEHHHAVVKLFGAYHRFTPY